MKIILLFFTIIFFSVNVSAYTIFYKNEWGHDWNIEKYPYPYVTMEIFFKDSVYVFDTSVHQPFYYFDNKKYTKEDMKDESNAMLSDIQWNENFISLTNYDSPNYSLDTINWVLKKGDIIYLCKKSNY